MKVSATVLVSGFLVSWMVAYPELVDSGALENIWEGTKVEGQDKPQGLIENFKLLKDKFTPPRLLESARFGRLGTPNPSRQQSNGNDEVSTPPLLKSLIFGKDNAIVSTISNVVGAAKGLIGRIKSNFQQEAGLPFLAQRDGRLAGVVPSLDKSDSARLKGHESSGNDDSRVPIAIERANSNAVIEGRANGYRESAEAGAEEKRAIHSAGSRASSEADAKTGASRGKQSAASQISAGEIEEKSVGAKRQSHSSVETGKKSLTSDDPKRERVPENREILSKKQLPASEGTNDRTKE